MKQNKFLELGFTKRNCWTGSDDYNLQKDGFYYTILFKKGTLIFEESFIQSDDDAIYLNSTDDFLKVFNSDNPWVLAKQIGEVCYE